MAGNTDLAGTRSPADTGIARQSLTLVVVIVAGEMIFSLPFHVARFFRPSFLETFGLTNTSLGDVFAVYGITATLAYFPGGVLADRFSARRLMASSLWATAAGGLYLATIPGPRGLACLFAYWGVTTILLFWAAMIRATREWGGGHRQGLAFGFLDGGRGLMAALAASLAVAVFRQSSVDGDSEEALVHAIYCYTVLTAAAGVAVWWGVPERKLLADNSAGAGSGLFLLLKNPLLWCQAGIVVCAYSAYKGLDNFALYAVDVLGQDKVRAAEWASYAAFLRPLSAFSAAFIAQYLSARAVLSGAFILLSMCGAVLTRATPETLGVAVLLAVAALVFATVYAMRAVYFALMGETSLPAPQTGAAAGLISLVGFTPDIFFTPLAGRILDASPGVEGHQNFYLLMAALGFLGLLFMAALAFFLRIPQRLQN